MNWKLIGFLSCVVFLLIITGLSALTSKKNKGVWGTMFLLVVVASIVTISLNDHWKNFLDYNFWNKITGKKCEPDCTNKTCGSDGCDGDCGDCANGGTCNNGSCTCTQGWNGDNCNNCTSTASCADHEICTDGECHACSENYVKTLKELDFQNNEYVCRSTLNVQPSFSSDKCTGEHKYYFNDNFNNSSTTRCIKDGNLYVCPENTIWGKDTNDVFGCQPSSEPLSYSNVF